MKKTLFIILGIIFLSIILFLFIGTGKPNKFDEKKFLESQKKQAEMDKKYAETETEAAKNNPFIRDISPNTNEYSVFQVPESDATYIIFLKGTDKEKSKQKFLNFVKEHNLDISNVNISYE